MSILFLILFLLSMFGLIAGLIKPTWFKLKSRKQSSVIFGVAIVIFFFLIGVTSGSNSARVETTSNVPTVTHPIPTTSKESAVPQKPLTLEEKIKNAVNVALGENTNMGKQTVVKVSVDSYNAVELKDYGYKPTDKVNGVLITINASENLTTNLQKGTMYTEAKKIFQAVFPLSEQIGDVVIWSQLPVKDQYGNTKDDTAITFAMARPLYQKINWSNFSDRDLPDLLNNEDRVDDRNGSHELIRF